MINICLNTAVVSNVWAMDYGSWPCSACEKKYKRRSNLKAHFRSEHRDLSNEHPEVFETHQSTKIGKRWQCPVPSCKCGYTRKGDLKYHFNLKHPEVLDAYPDLASKNSKKSKDHIRRTSTRDDVFRLDDESPSTADHENNPMETDECSTESESDSDFIPSHDDSIIYKKHNCPLCTERCYARSSDLKLHFQEIHPAKYSLYTYLFYESIEERDRWPCGQATKYFGGFKRAANFLDLDGGINPQ